MGGEMRVDTEPGFWWGQTEALSTEMGRQAGPKPFGSTCFYKDASRTCKTSRIICGEKCENSGVLDPCPA